MIYSVRPEYGFLKAYGCLCFPCLRDYNRHKLSMRSTPCTFIRYAQNQDINFSTKMAEFMFQDMLYLMKIFFPLQENKKPKTGVWDTPL